MLYQSSTPRTPTFQPDTLAQCSFDMCTCTVVNIMDSVQNALHVVVRKAQDDTFATDVFVKADCMDEIRR